MFTITTLAGDPRPHRFEHSAGGRAEPASPNPAARFQRWKDLAVALSYAGLSYAVAWSELLLPSPAAGYLCHVPPTRGVYAGTALSVLAAGFCVWALVRWLRRGKDSTVRRTAGYLAACLLPLIPLNAWRTVISDQLSELQPYLRYPLFAAVGRVGVAVIVALAVAAWLCVVLCWRRRTVQVLYNLLLILFPFVPLTFGQALFRMVVPPAAPPAAPATGKAALDGHGAGVRLLWLVYDELDFRLTFEQRPQGLRLPELDRLRRQSVFATRAYSPAASTLLTMPSLISGRLIEEARIEGPDRLMVRPRGSAAHVSWANLPSVFGRARELGFTTAVAGWYQPYCRVLGAWLDQCSWFEIALPRHSLGDSWASVMLNQARRLVETSQFSPFGQSLATRRHAETYREFMARATALAADPSLDLVLLHFPIPHAPFFYDRRTRSLTLANSAIGGYRDSLELVDHSLGALRQALETSGMWYRTAILLSSDHAFRSARALDGRTDARIPFLLRPPGAIEGLVHRPPLNTVVSHDLILAVLSGRVRQADEVCRWLAESAAGETGRPVQTTQSGVISASSL